MATQAVSRNTVFTQTEMTNEYSELVERIRKLEEENRDLINAYSALTNEVIDIERAAHNQAMAECEESYKRSINEEVKPLREEVATLQGEISKLEQKHWQAMREEQALGLAREKDLISQKHDAEWSLQSLQIDLKNAMDELKTELDNQMAIHVDLSNENEEVLRKITCLNSGSQKSARLLTPSEIALESIVGRQDELIKALMEKQRNFFELCRRLFRFE